MMKLLFYQFLRFLSDGKKIAVIVILFVLNLLSFTFFLQTDVETQQTEIFGDNMRDSRTNIHNTVKNAEEYRENLTLAYETAVHDRKSAMGQYAIYQDQLILRYGKLLSYADPSNDSFSDSRFFEYSYDSIYMAVAVLLFVLTIYTEDVSFDINPILRTTKKGRFPLAIAKQLAVILFSVWIVGCFLMVDLFIFGRDLPMNAPIQTLPEMAICPYSFTIGEYLAIVYLGKVMCVLLFTYFYLPAICFFGNVAVGSGMAIVTAALSWATSLVSVPSIFHLSNYISLYEISKINSLFSRYRAIAFGERQYSAIIVIFIGIIFCLILLSIFVGWLTIIVRYRNMLPKKETSQNHTKRIIRQIPKVVMRTYPTSLVTFELYKGVFSSKNYILLLIALSISVCIHWNGTSVASQSVNERLYREYMEGYSGETVEDSLWTAFKSEDIAATGVILDNKVQILRSSETAFARGELSLENYEKILNECADSSMREEVFSRIEEYDSYLSKKPSVSFVYDTGWNLVFHRLPDIPVYLALLLFAVGLSTIESERKTSAVGMEEIVRTTKFGRTKTFLCKQAMVTLCCAVVFIISEGVSVASIARDFPLPLLGASARSLLIFSDQSPDKTIGMMLLLHELFRWLYLWMFALFFSGTAGLLKSRLISIIIGVCVLLSLILFLQEGVLFTHPFYPIGTIVMALFTFVILFCAFRKWTK